MAPSSELFSLDTKFFAQKSFNLRKNNQIIQMKSLTYGKKIASNENCSKTSSFLKKKKKSQLNNMSMTYSLCLISLTDRLSAILSLSNALKPF